MYAKAKVTPMDVFYMMAPRVARKVLLLACCASVYNKFSHSQFLQTLCPLPYCYMLNPVVTTLEMELDGKIETCQSNFSLVFVIFTAPIETNSWKYACCILRDTEFSEILSVLCIFIHMAPGNYR